MNLKRKAWAAFAIVFGCSLILAYSVPSFACACDGEDLNDLGGYAIFFLGIFIFLSIAVFTMIMSIKVLMHWRSSYNKNKTPVNGAKD